MAGMRFDEKLVVFVDGAASPAEVESQLADVLFSNGCVKESFKDALLEREKNFPTALEVGEHNVAIPHTDAEHTVEGAICVGVLGKPVEWRRMDDEDETCDVDFVVMLALSDPHDHLEMLQKVIALVQDQDLIAKVVASDSAEQVRELVAPCLA